MKIVCEACQAKYSISDDKVRGKAFKIRCKKCSHIIVVRGAGDGASSSAPAESVSGVDAAWHIVVDGEQVGPLSESDVRARLSRGEVNGDTYIWKEGLADWLKISAVPEFAGAATGGDAAAAYSPEPTGGYGSGVTDQGFATAYPSEPSHPAQPAQAAGYDEPDVFAAPTVVAPASNGDLFGSAVAASSSAAPSSPSFSFGSPSYAAPEPAPRASSNGSGAHAAVGGGGGRLESLTGQRHENSVLFSLSNLEALAAPAAAPAARAPSASSGTNTEGSGLIDIRSMAAVTLGRSSAASESRASHDLPAFAGPQFSPVAPVLLPMGAPSGPPKWVYPVVGLMVLVMVALSVGIFMVLRSTPVAQAPVAAPVVAAAPVAPAAETAPVDLDDKKAAAPAATPPPSDDEPLPPREAKPAAAAKPQEKRTKAPAKKGSKASEPSRAPAAVVAAPKAEPAKPKDSIDSLLEHAMGTRKAPVARGGDDDVAPKRAAAVLPPLQREDIVKAMTGVNGKVKNCYQQFKVPGTAMVNVTVAEGGRVSSVGSTGKFAGTPTGSCVENAVRSARFPAVKGLNFPWSFTLR